MTKIQDKKMGASLNFSFPFQEKLEGRILGCVKEIVDWGLILELPNFLGAAVHITEISDVYSELMEKYSSGQIEVRST